MPDKPYPVGQEKGEELEPKQESKTGYDHDGKSVDMGAPLTPKEVAEGLSKALGGLPIEIVEKREERMLLNKEDIKRHGGVTEPDDGLEDVVANYDELRKFLGWNHGSGEFYELLIEMGGIHSRKNHDYTATHPLENFFLVAFLTGITPEQVVEVFVQTKSVRIRSLLEKGVSPENESIRDSYVDRAVYSTIGAVIHGMSGEDKDAIMKKIISGEIALPMEDEDDF